jgi:hypothetical protein
MTFIAESDRPLLPAVERGRAHVDVAVLRSSTYERRSARDHTRSRQGVYTENAASTHSVEASATISPLSDRLIPQSHAAIRARHWMPDLSIWNKLTRREQRIVIKLFGGGSLHGDSPIETGNLMRLGLITENGLTSVGLEVFTAAFSAMQGEPARVGVDLTVFKRTQAGPRLL